MVLMRACVLCFLLMLELSSGTLGEQQYQDGKRFLFETTTSHFADSKLAAMESAVLELRARVQQLEEKDQIENTLAYRLNHEFNTVQNELNATLYRQEYLMANIIPRNDAEYMMKKIRLVDALGHVNSVRGRVELYHNNSWGTVCDDSFSSTDGRVVCRMLGWRDNEVNPYAHGSAYYGMGKGQVLLDDLACRGTEKVLWNCTNPGWNVVDCGHGEDVGVDCFFSSSNYLPAFHAEATSFNTITSIRANQSLAFRHVLFNQGNHYSSSTGEFTCTVPGTYVFHLGLKPHGNVPVKAYIMRYSSDRFALVDSSDGHGSTRFASNVAIVKLSRGQRVFVRVDTTQSSGARLDNEMNYFTGYLLYPNM